MTDPKPDRKPVFIEKIMPVTLLNEQVYYEHGGNPFKGLHRWYSRKPLSFSRASVLGSLLPADVTMDEFEYLLGLNRRGKDGLQDKTTKLYKTPPSPERIKKVQELCEQMWGTKTPTVLDAFAGGGSIPFEAARYGLNVLASDLNPVAVVTMKAAIEYPLKFGADLQVEIDKWVKWVGDEAEKRLAPFFPSLPGEKVQTYFWAHTVTCPGCKSVVPLSPNWWLYRRAEKQSLSKWCAVKPIPDPESKQISFELIQGGKGSGITIQNNGNEYDPEDWKTVARSIGKCPNCSSILEQDYLIDYAQKIGFGHQMYGVAYKVGDNSVKFRTPTKIDIEGFNLAQQELSKLTYKPDLEFLIPKESCSDNPQYMMAYRYGLTTWNRYFNVRQLLTSITYVEIINNAKSLIQSQHKLEEAEAILVYLGLTLDRCLDKNCRLSHLNASKGSVESALGQHSLNLMWNYPEISVFGLLWEYQGNCTVSDYGEICKFLDKKPKFETIPGIEVDQQKSVQINAASADDLSFIPDKSLIAIVTDHPYYDTIPYSELSDFFYVWLRRIFNDILPDIFWSELTDKDREAVANLGRFRNMSISPKELAYQDYEAKMALAFAEYYRVLRDDGVMTVQFNHKDSDAWDVLAKSLIDAGFEITASWAVSTENPQNLHQAQKNSVSSAVLLVCRKRDPNAGQAWWDDLRPDVANLVEQRAPEFEANDITGIDLYLSAFGLALNVFSRNYPILDSSGNEVSPEEAFAEARRAIANYRFYKLAQTDTQGFDPLTTWYMLAWDAFRAREFPFDDARQLALAVGGFNVADLAKTYKLIDSTSGTCKFLTPQQRHKRRAFSLTDTEFSARYLIDALHAIITLYLEEGTIEPVRRFLKATGLLSNDLFMRSWEVALKVIPRIGDERKRIPEEKALADLWLAMDEIRAKVVYVQPELELGYGQQTLNFDAEVNDE
jgi:adenine-specific DNA methylase